LLKARYQKLPEGYTPSEFGKFRRLHVGYIELIR